MQVAVRTHPVRSDVEAEGGVQYRSTSSAFFNTYQLI
jgi:hypothetical protein